MAFYQHSIFFALPLATRLLLLQHGQRSQHLGPSLYALYMVVGDGVVAVPDLVAAAAVAAAAPPPPPGLAACVLMT